ncbi:aminodeoxychorismate synthase component I [Undibacterium hunanense]|uniref:aminodeoxychorismate synthase component I n=1 Tax=Undibacterium hunanense TaxID=2762292 RepID=UPI002E2F250C|nr:aminodeoxychorismate synthase component I [Undibacterium hunanense]
MSDFPNNVALPFPLPLAGECFALLDDAQARTAQSRLYTGLQARLSCRSKEEWAGLWQDTQAALQQGCFAVAVLSYETGAQLQDIAPRTGQALSQILLFRHCHVLTSAQVQDFLSAQSVAGAMPDSGDIAGIAGVHANVDATQFDAGIASVLAYIAAGDTYQVNYTYRLHFDTYGSPLALYQRLRLRQPVPYGALICMPDGEAVLSFSPELFVRHEQGQLLARPMKGTAAASGDADEDKRLAAALAADSKNRAENLMIVDLLRNDLGRIAATGSVTVPALFEVSRFSSVLQMTSTVQAQLRDGLGLTEILTALFPCGSITGAPKRRTMQIIRELEREARGLYTGAIGWFDPPQAHAALGDFCLSVPIRTLQLQAPSVPQINGVRRGVLGVGAGIVYDSVAQEEFAECHLKASFLTGLPAQFELFETMYASREDGCRHIDRHLQRLRASASYFGFAWDEALIRQRITEACQQLPAAQVCRLRLAIDARLGIKLSSGVLSPLPARPTVMLATTTTRGDDLFLRHKSSVRQQYDAAWQAAEQQGAFDMLFFNENARLTEGGRSSVLLKKNGVWLTPPVSDGVLPGIMRAVLLDDPEFGLRESSLVLDDLLNAEKIMLCNALRGAFEVELLR